MMTRSSRIALSAAASLLLVASLMEEANARGEGRGGRGGGGGGGASFSRSGPAAGGSFSSQRAATPTAARQTGAAQRSGQRTETQQTRSQSRADTHVSGQQERTERQGQRQQGQTERTDTRQQAYTERTDIRGSTAQNISGDWDSHRYYDDDDDEWGYALAGAAVGATAGFIAGAATAPSSPTYVTVLPCTPNVVAAGGVNYYGCGGTWYGRSYVNGNVTYVTVSPPPGY